MTEEFLNAFREKYAAKATGRWKHWVAQLDLKTCARCSTMHGKIYPIGQIVSGAPPLHMYCRCKIKPMSTVRAEESTQQGSNGAPYWLKNYNCLPACYITDQELQALGWKWGKAPSKYAPGRVPTMGVYRNENGHLPSAAGRIWYEADINYISGKRNAQRVLWSSDGLLFVTYDHYQAFVEIV